MTLFLRCNLKIFPIQFHPCLTLWFNPVDVFPIDGDKYIVNNTYNYVTLFI